MTLVLTEVSKIGIAMAADSMITYGYDKNTGRPLEKDQQNWQKLLKAKKIHAGVSYWGLIGLITANLPHTGKNEVQFDAWLKELIDTQDYTDLPTLADKIATSINKACRGKILKEPVGIHVAGFSKWEDGFPRPTFYHVHNGHLGDPRKLFEKHLDFPFESRSLKENIAFLESGNRYTTRNGDFMAYAVIWKQLETAFAALGELGVQVPRQPSHLSSRKGYLHMALEVMIKIYQCSNKGTTIGGVVTSLGVGSNGYSDNAQGTEPICPNCNGTGRIRGKNKK